MSADLHVDDFQVHISDTLHKIVFGNSAHVECDSLRKPQQTAGRVKECVEMQPRHGRGPHHAEHIELVPLRSRK